MTNAATTFTKYSFLKELGLQEQNAGVFDGEKWFGSGELLTSTNPTTNEAIATVRGATIVEYNQCVNAAVKAQREWRVVRLLCCVAASFFCFCARTAFCIRSFLTRARAHVQRYTR